MNTDTFNISTKKSDLDLDVIVNYLSNESYWAKGRSRPDIQKSIQHSICFGVYTADGEQAGFARVVSDRIIFAWIMDVFITEKYRSKGLGKLLMSAIMNHKYLRHVKNWGLATKDAHGLYEKFGFKLLLNPGKMMEFNKPVVKKDIE